MPTKTDLLLQYADLSWNYDFPQAVEIALENDYVANKDLYDESVLKNIALLLLIAPDTSPQLVLDNVKIWRSDCKELPNQETN